jgi:hypothetical protein
MDASSAVSLARSIELQCNGIGQPRTTNPQEVEPMKKVLTIVMALTLIAAMGALAADEKADMAMAGSKWFDMPNCEFCKNLIEDEHLLENMTWEHHDITNGCLTITTVSPEYMDSYKKAQDAMMTVGEEMQSGKRNPMEVKMCGHCQAYGGLMMAGAKTEYVKGDAAEIVLMTADDEATIKKIKEFAEKNRVELAKWKAEMMEK